MEGCGADRDRGSVHEGVDSGGVLELPAVVALVDAGCEAGEDGCIAHVLQQLETEGQFMRGSTAAEFLSSQQLSPW